MENGKRGRGKRGPNKSFAGMGSFRVETPAAFVASNPALSTPQLPSTLSWKDYSSSFALDIHQGRGASQHYTGMSSFRLDSWPTPSTPESDARNLRKDLTQAFSASSNAVSNAESAVPFPSTQGELFPSSRQSLPT